MLKQKEAQKIYDQIRPKILREAAKSLSETQIVEQLIDKEREPTRIALLKWLKSELEVLIKNDLQLSSPTPNLSSLSPFQRLSLAWFNDFTKSKLSILKEESVVESPPLFDAFGKKVGYIGPILLQSSTFPNGEITFRFQVEKPNKALQQKATPSINASYSQTPSQDVQGNLNTRRGFRI